MWRGGAVAWLVVAMVPDQKLKKSARKNQIN